VRLSAPISILTGIVIGNAGKKLAINPIRLRRAREDEQILRHRNKSGRPVHDRLTRSAQVHIVDSK